MVKGVKVKQGDINAANNNNNPCSKFCPVVKGITANTTVTINHEIAILHVACIIGTVLYRLVIELEELMGTPSILARTLRVYLLHPISKFLSATGNTFLFDAILMPILMPFHFDICNDDCYAVFFSILQFFTIITGVPKSTNFDNEEASFSPSISVWNCIKIQDAVNLKVDSSWEYMHYNITCSMVKMSLRHCFMSSRSKAKIYAPLQYNISSCISMLLQRSLLKTSGEQKG